MKHLQPVVWSKGTLLTPQHLQAQDRAIEDSLAFTLNALQYEAWGFKEIRIDQAALSKGVFSISKASGIFPDGLLFDVPDSDPGPAAKPLEKHFEPGQDMTDIHLAIPQYLDRGVNISAPQQNAATRYTSEMTTVRDENSGATPRSIQVARKNFSLLAEGENRRGVSSMRVARVRKTNAGTFELDPSFVPPLLDIAGSDYLMTLARRLVEILAAKSSNLAGMRREKNQSLVDFGASDIANFWLLYTINTHLPLFRHLFETRRGHPERFFDLMLSLAGALTTFSNRIQPRDLPTYDHSLPGACFSSLDEKLRLLLETVVPSNCVSLPLKSLRPSIYATAIENDKYLLNTKMYLAVSAQMSEADLIRKSPAMIKLCSADQVEQLVRQALPGIRLTHLSSPPSSIPVKLNYHYFSLNQSGSAWEGVTRARNVAAYVPEDFPDCCPLFNRLV